MEFLDGLDRAIQRRYWPVLVTEKIDTDAVAAIRDAAWAEARDAYRAGERWWLENESELDSYLDTFIAQDPLEDAFLHHVARDGAASLHNLSGAESTKRITLETGEVPDPKAKKMSAVVGKHAKRLGLEKGKSNGRKVWRHLFKNLEESKGATAAANTEAIATADRAIAASGGAVPGYFGQRAAKLAA